MAHSRDAKTEWRFPSHGHRLSNLSAVYGSHLLVRELDLVGGDQCVQPAREGCYAFTLWLYDLANGKGRELRRGPHALDSLDVPQLVAGDGMFAWQEMERDGRYRVQVVSESGATLTNFDGSKSTQMSIADGRVVFDQFQGSRQFLVRLSRDGTSAQSTLPSEAYLPYAHGKATVAINREGTQVLRLGPNGWRQIYGGDELYGAIPLGSDVLVLNYEGARLLSSPKKVLPVQFGPRIGICGSDFAYAVSVDRSTLRIVIQAVP